MYLYDMDHCLAITLYIHRGEDNTLTSCAILYWRHATDSGLPSMAGMTPLPFSKISLFVSSKSSGNPNLFHREATYKSIAYPSPPIPRTN